MSVGEALTLTWGDIDFDSGRFRISVRRTKRRTAGQRWLPVPRPLLDEIAGLIPFENRERDTRVFGNVADSAPRIALKRAAENAGLVHYHPHDLRHRRISLWFAHGVDQVTVATWAGRSKPSMSSDIYGHALVSRDDEGRDFWIETYRGERLPKGAATASGDDMVMTRENPNQSNPHR